jgi:hypothetical protein
MFKQNQSPSTKKRVHHRSEMGECGSPCTARTMRAYTMYSEAANRTGGRSRNMLWRRKGVREPVLFVARARQI